MTSTNKVSIQNALDPKYPSQPIFNKNCPINQIYQSLPPSSINSSSYPTLWERTAAGPTSIKHLYTGIPNWYPFQTIDRPIGTMYEHDYSQFHETGVGKGKRISYQYKAYPLTNRNVRETRIYADYMLPYMELQNFVKHPVKRDSTLNSSLQNRPYPFYPEDY